jgi:hypothetical protein
MDAGGLGDDVLDGQKTEGMSSLVLRKTIPLSLSNDDFFERIRAALPAAFDDSLTPS